MELDLRLLVLKKCIIFNRSIVIRGLLFTLISWHWKVINLAALAWIHLLNSRNKSSSLSSKSKTRTPTRNANFLNFYIRNERRKKLKETSGIVCRKVCPVLLLHRTFLVGHLDPYSLRWSSHSQKTVLTHNVNLVKPEDLMYRNVCMTSKNFSCYYCSFVFFFLWRENGWSWSRHPQGLGS